MHHDSYNFKARSRLSVESDYVFLRDKFLADFPHYAELFIAVGMTDNIWLHATRDDVRSTLGARFNAELSFHKPGRISADLAWRIPSIREASNLAGYMTRYGKGAAMFHVAVTTIDKASSYVDRGTAIHEYGHYVEQRVAANRGYPPGPLQKRNTAFKYAYALVTATGSGATDGLCSRFAADEFIAWINAIWLCWMLRIDPKTVVVGMVLDAISHPESFAPYVHQSLPLIVKAEIFSNRAAAEHIFESAGRYTLSRGLRVGTDTSDVRLCEQIDRASSTLLDLVIRSIKQ